MKRFSLAVLGLLAVAAWAGPPKDDASCRAGERGIDLSYQFPPYKDQGGSGACYSFAANAALEAALYRRDGKIHNLSETYALATAALALSDDGLRQRVEQVKQTAGKGENAESFGSGGLDGQVLAAMIKRGHGVLSPPADLADFRNFNDRMTRQSLDKGVPYYLDGTPFRFHLGKLQPMQVGDLRGSLTRKLSALERGRSVDLRGLGLQTIDLHFDQSKPLVDLNPLSQMKGAWNEIWHPPTQADRKSPYTGYANATRLRTASLELFHAKELAQMSRLVEGFERFTASRDPGHRWSSALSDAEVDRFFGDSLNQDLLIEYVRQHSRSLPGRTVGEQASELVDQLTRTRWYKTWLAQHHPDLAAQRGKLGFTAKEADAVVRNHCDATSRGVQNKILENLCRGIPAVISTDMNGVDRSIPAPNSPRGWTWIRSQSSSTAQHAMVVQGLQTDRDPRTGKETKYLVMRNTWKDSHLVRFPLSEACRIQSLSVVMTPEEQRAGARPALPVAAPVEKTH